MASWFGPFQEARLATRRALVGCVESPGFDANRVVRIEVELFDGGALDDLVYDPYP